MSIFDKFNANPYISTYAGAPIAEFNQTAGTLQQRMLQNISKKNEMELALEDTLSTSMDEDFKAQKIAEYQTAIKEIAEAPEYATQKVMALGHRRAMDQDFRLMEKNAKAQAAIEAQMEELDVSHPQRRKYEALLQRYNELDDEGKMGAAAGRKFGTLNLYEEQVLGDLVEDRVKGIKAMKYGNAKLNPENGTIETLDGEVVSKERVRSSAMGVLADPKVRRQVEDEAAAYVPGYNEMSAPERGQAMSDYFMDTYVTGALSKYATRSQTTGLKGGRKDLGWATRDKPVIAAPVFVQSTEDYVQDRLPKVQSHRDFQIGYNEVKGRLNNSNDGSTVVNDVIADTHLKGMFERVFDESVASPVADLSPQAQEVLKKMFRSGALDRVGVSETAPKSSYKDGALLRSTETPKLNEKQARAMLEKLNPTFSESQLDEYTDEITKYANGSWLATDFNDMIKKHGQSKIATPTQHIAFTDELKKLTNSENVDEALSTQLSNISRSQNYKALTVQDPESKEYRPIDEDDLENVDFDSVKLTELPLQGAPGVLTVQFAKRNDDGKNEVPKSYRINLNATESNVAEVLGNQLMQAANSEEGRQNASKLQMAAYQLGQQNFLRSAQTVVNKGSSDMKNKLPLATREKEAMYATAHQTSALYLMKHPTTGMFRIEKENGEIVGIERASRDQAIASLIVSTSEILSNQQ